MLLKNYNLADEGTVGLGAAADVQVCGPFADAGVLEALHGVDSGRNPGAHARAHIIRYKLVHPFLA